MTTTTEETATTGEALAGQELPVGTLSEGTGLSESTGPADAIPAEPTPGRGLDSLRRPLVLLVLAVLLAGIATAGMINAQARQASSAATNRALVDQQGTAEVDAAVTVALGRVLSYSTENADGPEATARAADTLLTGQARADYERLFARVRALAPAQKIRLTTRVTESAVQFLDSDRAVVLVFLDQSTQRGDSATETQSAAQLTISAEYHDNQWLITGLTPS